MGKQMGRPKKVATEVKLQIIDHFLISVGAEDEHVMQQHGIYSKLANFAKEKGYELESHDFSRDLKVRNYLQSISGTVENSNSVGIPIYEPLDIPYVINKPRTELGIILRDREEYFQGLYRRAVAALERYEIAAASNRLLKEQTMQMEQQRDALEKQCRCAEKIYREEKKENEYLRRYIKKELSPKQADDFFKRLASQEMAIQIASQSATMPMEELTREDRKLRREAENVANIGNIIDFLSGKGG